VILIRVVLDKANRFCRSLQRQWLVTGFGLVLFAFSELFNLLKYKKMNAKDYLKSKGLFEPFVTLDNYGSVSVFYVENMLNEYHELKVKELKENANSGDKNILSESTDANGTKPMIGSCAFTQDKDIFISESPSQNPIGSMEKPQKENVCKHEYTDHDGICQSCGKLYFG
jgi:hypothetical protein